MSNPKGETIEVPVQSSFREGLTLSEFFISHGARKGSKIPRLQNLVNTSFS